MLDIAAVFSMYGERGETPVQQHEQNCSPQKIPPDRGKCGRIGLFTDFWEVFQRDDSPAGDSSKFAKRFKISTSRSICEFWRGGLVDCSTPEFFAEIFAGIISGEEHIYSNGSCRNIVENNFVCSWCGLLE